MHTTTYETSFLGGPSRKDTGRKGMGSSNLGMFAHLLFHEYYVHLLFVQLMFQLGGVLGEGSKEGGGRVD